MSATPHHIDHLTIADRFAKALDHEDYPTAIALLDEACVYTVQGKTHDGRDAIVASYDAAGQAGKRFDSLTYESEVRAGDDGWTIIRFRDLVEHKGHTLDHHCEQWLRINDAGLIERIEHRDLPGEVEKYADFKKAIGEGS